MTDTNKTAVDREFLVSSAIRRADEVSQLIFDGKRVPLGDTEDLRNHVRKLARYISENAPSPRPATTAETQPRYTTKRVREEVAKAKETARLQALEEAALLVESYPSATGILLGALIHERKTAQPPVMPEVAVPDGWHLVPKAATPEMIEAISTSLDKNVAIEDLWRRAIEVSPDTPSVIDIDRLFDENMSIGDDEGRMTAAEEVLAWLLVEKIGVPDDAPYTPFQAQEAIVAKLEQLKELDAISEMLGEGQGDDEGSPILPDFDKGTSVYAKVESCLMLLERRRDVIDGFVASEGKRLSRDIVLSDDLVDLVRQTFKAKVEEYDRDFQTEGKPDGFWAGKYGTNLHATYLGERWAMTEALKALGHAFAAQELPKAVAIAKMLYARSDFNLRTNDLWSDSAKEMARHIIGGIAGEAVIDEEKRA